MRNWPFRFAAIGVLIAVVAAYSNHFENGFHFDDGHTIVQNPAIRDLHNIPSFFTDGRTMSVLPANQSYRPVVTLSLAIDYWLAGGLHPFAFHATVFIWYLLLLAFLFFLFGSFLVSAWPGRADAAAWTALAATAWFGLHPASAETVNYVIQRADLYVALGLVSSFLFYVRFPELRRWYLYLLPYVAAALSKPTALIFPLLLMLYCIVFEQSTFRSAAQRALPSFMATAVLALVHHSMTPPSFSSATSPWLAYAMTQPYVAAHYFVSWFLPLWLTADSDFRVLPSIWTPDAILGFAVLAVIVTLAICCRRSPEFRPVTFGLLWFLISLVPTTLMPLAEVENDHRMFLPFVGLALAATSALSAFALRLRPSRAWSYTTIGICVSTLIAYGAGAYQRNRVWRTDETLWRDVTEKSPTNGRGWMNYGLSLMEQGRYEEALRCYQTSQRYSPAYPYLEINFGIVRAAMNDPQRAEAHFRRALALTTADAQPHFFYGRFLAAQARIEDARRELNLAVAANPQYEDARALLSRLQPARQSSPEEYLRSSLLAYQAGRYRECIDQARRALALRPDYAEAYNNIAAGHQALHEWDRAIAAARTAVRIRPDLQLARNNLAFSEQQKRRSSD